MPTEVILPKVDMDMATGQISRWFHQEGAKVKKGETLFEIETDKAAMEVEAPADGILHDVTGKEKIDIPVGQVVAWIYAEGEAYVSGSHTSTGTPATEIASKEAAPATSSPSPSIAHQLRDIVSAEAERGDKVRATPLARRIAKKEGIDIATVPGTGPRGRVGKVDIQAAISSRGVGDVRTAAPISPGISDEATLQLFETGSYELIPHDNMRKTIARRLVEAKQTIPHFNLRVSCRIDDLLELRRQANAMVVNRKDGNPAIFKLSINDFVVKALAQAYMDVPDANVSWTEANMVKHRHADIGVAVSVPGGLITPIVRQVDQKRVSAISNEMRDLATRARERKLRPEEYKGGTAAVSNLGMYNVEDFTAIINPPHAAILAVGAGEQRPIVRDGQIEIATMMTVVLAVDHRAIDGALGAELLAAFKHHIENPLGMLI